MCFIYYIKASNSYVYIQLIGNSKQVLRKTESQPDFPAVFYQHNTENLGNYCIFCSWILIDKIFNFFSAKYWFCMQCLLLVITAKWNLLWLSWFKTKIISSDLKHETERDHFNLTHGLFPSSTSAYVPYNEPQRRCQSPMFFIPYPSKPPPRQ